MLHRTRASVNLVLCRHMSSGIVRVGVVGLVGLIISYIILFHLPALIHNELSAYLFLSKKDVYPLRFVFWLLFKVEKQSKEFGSILSYTLSMSFIAANIGLDGSRHCSDCSSGRISGVGNWSTRWGTKQWHEKVRLYFRADKIYLWQCPWRDQLVLVLSPANTWNWIVFNEELSR